MTNIARTLRLETGATIRFESDVAKALRLNHFDPVTNEIHLIGGPGMQRRGFFYEEVQHALDHHAGAYGEWTGEFYMLNDERLSKKGLHSITARRLIDNPLLPTTARDNAGLFRLSLDWAQW